MSRLGVETPLANSFYALEQDMQRPRVKPVAGVLPAVPTGGVVASAFGQGMAPAGAACRQISGRPCSCLRRYYYEYRNETSVGEGYMPFGVSSLIERYRTVRLFAGSGQ